MNTRPYDPADYPHTYSDAEFHYFVEEAIPVTADTQLAPRFGRPSQPTMEGASDSPQRRGDDLPKPDESNPNKK